MTHQMEFTYLACQTCQAKIHCERCGEEVSQSLLNMSGVDSVELNMITRRISISGNVDFDDLECKLEDLGFLLD